MAQDVDRPTPTAASHQKRRATERQARVCGPSAAQKAGAGALERLNNVLKGHVLSVKYRLLAVLVDRHLDCGMSISVRAEVGHCH